jgi:hypothetical protein
LGKHLSFRFFDFDKNLRLEGFFFFLIWKLKKPLISVFYQNIAKSKEPLVSVFYKVFQSKEPVGLMKEPTKNQQFRGRFFARFRVRIFLTSKALSLYWRVQQWRVLNLHTLSSWSWRLWLLQMWQFFLLNTHTL